MSGSTAQFPFPTSLGTAPPASEGSKFVQLSVNWSTALPVATGVNTLSTSLDLLAQFQSGQFTTVQSVYIDHSTNAYPLYLVCAQTLHRIVVPAFSTGVYPLVVGPAPKFVLTLDVALGPFTLNNTAPLPVGTTRLWFLNEHHPEFQNVASVYGAGGNSFSAGFAFPTGVPQPVFPALYANQHWAISAISMTLLVTGAATWPATGVTSIYLREPGTTNWMVRDAFNVVALTPNAVVYQRQLIFPTPVIQPTAATGLQLELTQYPTGGPCTIWLQASYGIVTVS